MIRLITAQQLKDVTGSLNLNDNYINTCIDLAQEKTTQVILGTRLYQRMQELVDLNDWEQYPIYKGLYDFVTLQLICQTMGELVFFTTFKTRIAGLATTSNEHVVTATMKDCESMKENYLANANFYEGRIKAYLCQHCNEIAEYHANNNVDEIKPKHSFNSQIFLGGYYDTCRNRRKDR